MPEMLNPYRFVCNNPLAKSDPTGLATITVVVEMNADPTGMDGGWADTAFPGVRTLLPKWEWCFPGVTRRFVSESVAFTTTVRFARGHSPDDRAPDQPGLTLLQHEAAHVAQLANYLTRLETTLVGMQATKCVCAACFNAKNDYLWSANLYYHDMMMAASYDWDLDQDSGDIYRDAANRELPRLRARLAQMQRVCGFAGE